MSISSLRLAIGASFLTLAACGSDATTTSSADAGTSSAGSAQTPPATNAADVEAWLATGAYKSWHCESAPHPSRDPSPHGINRICSNDLTSAFSGSGERPEGSAGVKELYGTDGTSIVGYATYVKTKAASAGGDAWYWYERVPLDSMAPHDAKGVVADGLGTTTNAKQICVSCHAGAGSDAAHTPTPGGGDQVYTQVK
jgi:hypothetical protein